MGLPVGRLIALGTAASGVAVAGCMGGAVGGALAGVVGGVLANYIATLTEQKFQPSSGDTPETLIKNHDLRKLVGEAIRDTILLETIDPKPAGRLADQAVEHWMSDSAAGDSSLNPLSEQSVVSYFCTDDVSFDQQTALDVATWRTFLVRLADVASIRPDSALIDRLADSLHRKLPQMLRGMVKKDFTGDTEAKGRGYASLELVLLGRMVAGVDELLKRDRPSDGLLEQLKRFNERLPQAVERQNSRIKDPRERIVVSRVIEQINQLRPHLDKRLDELLHVVRSEGVKSRKEVRGVDRKVVYALVGIGLLVIMGLAGWAVMEHKTSRIQQQIASLSQYDRYLDEVARRQQQQILANPNIPYRPSEEERKMLEEIERNGNAIQKARAAALRGDFVEAKRQIDLVDEKTATEQAFRLFLTKGDIAFFQGEYDLSIEPYGKAFVLRPEDIEVRLSLAGAHKLARLGDVAEHRKQAIHILEETIKLVLVGSNNWAATQNNLGNAWRGLPTGDKVENLRKAIDCYTAALTVYTQSAYPADWAMTQNNLGTAWSGLPTGDKEENLRKAIACYSASLIFYTRSVYPADWARTQNNLGNAWSNLPTGDKGENLRKAIACYTAALTVYTQSAYPADWAMTQNNLGTAWSGLPTGDKGENLRKAIACYTAALTVYTQSAYPADWAMTQYNLGVAWYELPTGDKEGNLRKAIDCYTAALTVYTQSAHPADWAMTQNNLGTAWSNFPTGDKEGNLRKAIACYTAALTVRTRSAYPADWAATQINLGIAWSNLPTGDNGENLRKAIACHTAALTVYTQSAYPANWAATQNNLGTAWSDLPTGDKGENLRKAIACHTAALTVYTQSAYPADWAMTQNNLGGAWHKLPTGDKGENLRKAIACYTAALTVFTQSAYPADWAMTQNNLGGAWHKLPTGDKGENLRKAIACYTAALTVRTQSAYPADWAMTQYNLGLAYFILSERPGQDQCALSRRGIACMKGALTIYTPNAFPGDYANATEALSIMRGQYDSSGCAKAISFDEIAPAK